MTKQVFCLGLECVMNLTPALSTGEGARIDISNLPAGVYYLKMGNEFRKLMLMR